MEQELVDVKLAIARIETKLDNALKADADQEARLRVLERRDAYVLGASAVISFIAAYALKKIGL